MLGRIKVVRDVDVVACVLLRKWAEGVDVANCVEGGLVEGCVTAPLRDLDIRGSSVALDLESDVDAMAICLRVAHSCVPLRGGFLGNLLDVIGETSAEGWVLRCDAGSARPSLDAAH